MQPPCNLSPTSPRAEHTAGQRRAWRSQVALGLAACGFVALTLAARASPYLPFDPLVSRQVQALQSPWLTALAEFVSWFGSPPQTDVLLGLLVGGLWLGGKRPEAAAVLVAGLGSAVLYFLTQQLVGQPRPSSDLVRVAGPLALYAFPSGHATTFTAVLGFFAFLVSTNVRGRAIRWLGLIAIAVVIGLVCLARVYLGAHWLSDVLGGVVLGCLWLLVTIQLYRWLAAKPSMAAGSS
jgi:undecaprenyl-diphosphatase